jgi:hypothetical protein
MGFGMPSCARFSVYSTKILCNIYLFSNLVDHLSFFGHVVLVEEPLTVTNILGSDTEKILVTAGGSCTNNT